MTYDDNVVRALQTLREAATHPSVGASLRQALNVLDNAGVFAAVDEQTGYDTDGGLLAAHQLPDVDPEPVHAHQAGHLTGSVDPDSVREGMSGRPVDPAEWGGTRAVR
jgi:hypothetical protein